MGAGIGGARRCPDDSVEGVVVAAVAFAGGETKLLDDEILSF